MDVLKWSPFTTRMSLGDQDFTVTAYIFHLLNRHDHIAKARLAECKDEVDVLRRAISLLNEHQVAAVIEAWDHDKLICRIKRPTAPCPSSPRPLSDLLKQRALDKLLRLAPLLLGGRD